MLTYCWQYYVSGTFSIPYFDIVEPIELFYDGVNNRELFNYYNGVVSNLATFTAEKTFRTPISGDSIR
jgi:hypothetical protein